MPDCSDKKAGRSSGARGANGAKDAAMRLLSIRARSSSEMRRRLALKGYSQQDIDAVLRSLEANGLIDDARFAMDRAGAMTRRLKGPARIMADLSSRGISREIVDEAVGAVSGEEGSVACLALEAWLRKKRLDTGALRDSSQRQKAFGFLRTRGFAFEAASRAIDSCLKGMPLGLIDVDK